MIGTAVERRLELQVDPTRGLVYENVEVEVKHTPPYRCWSEPESV